MKPAARIARKSPEADIQRSIVKTLRLLLPAGSIVHHSPNEVRQGGEDGRLKQALAVGMGLHPGFSDLIVLSEGRVLFLELKAPTGRLSESQRIFRDRVRAQGHAWGMARSLDEALDVLRAEGFATRIRSLA